MDEFKLSHQEFTARAAQVGEQIDLRALGSTQRLAGGPLLVPVRNGGAAVLFRFGVVVFFDVAPLDEDEFLRQLRPRINSPYEDPEREETRIRIDPEAKEVVEGNVVYLRDAAPERLQIVADVLSKSVILGRYETLIAQSFDRIEPLAVNLEREGSLGLPGRELKRHLGAALMIEQKMIGRVQVDDTPDILWERPDLERVYVRLRDEFDLRDRYAALNRKIELISRTVETVLELLQNQRALQLEWYIVAMILIELAISIYQLIMQRHG